MWKFLAVLLVGWLLWLGFQGEDQVDDADRRFEREVAKVDPETSPLIAEGDWAGLVAVYATREQRRKLSPVEHYRKARALYELGQFQPALMSVESSMKDGALSSGHREMKARCLLKMEQADDARTWLELWLKESPEHPEANYLLGVALIDEKQYTPGLKALHRAVKLESTESVAARRLLADTYMHLGIEARKGGDYTAAATWMETAVGLDPENGPFNAALGRVYVGLKRWPEALDALDLAHDHGVSGGDALTGLMDDLCTTHHELAAVALIESRLEDALRHAREGLQWVTNRTARERLKGLERTVRTRYVEELKRDARRGGDGARTLWRKILILEPTDPEALWEDSRGLDPERRREIEKLVLESEWGFEARLRLARRARAEGRQEEVLELLCEAWLISKGGERLRLEEEIFEHLVEWGVEPPLDEWELLWRWRRHEDNSLVWSKMIPEVEAAFPDRWFLLAYRAAVHQERGEGDEAKRLLGEIRQLDPPARAEKRLETLRGG